MAPLPVQGIGILSTIAFDKDPAQIAFQAGVNQAAGFYYNIQDNIGFNGAQLTIALNKLLNDPKVGMIVTCGGLVTCQEAVTNDKTKPFISLIGWLPPAPFSQPPSGQFIGCVNLNVIDEDPDRIHGSKTTYRQRKTTPKISDFFAILLARWDRKR
jgi:hypothetical protein